MDFSHTIKVASVHIQFSEVVKLLGVTLDTSVSFDQQLTMSSVRVISTFRFGHCDICDHLSPLSRQN